MPAFNHLTSMPITGNIYLPNYNVSKLMTILILILFIVITAIASIGVIWFVFKRKQALSRKEPAKETTRTGTLTFRWSYIILPAVILLLSIILTAYFYHLLPANTAYHFKPDGTPDKWLSREITIVWLLVSQLLLTLLAGGITWGATKLVTLFRQLESTGIRLERILSLMGNMIALPQIILFFTMLDIFSYNSYQIHLMPMWISALVIMGLGGVILGVFFIRAIQQSREAIR